MRQITEAEMADFQTEDLEVLVKVYTKALETAEGVVRLYGITRDTSAVQSLRDKIAGEITRRNTPALPTVTEVLEEIRKEETRTNFTRRACPGCGSCKWDREVRGVQRFELHPEEGRIMSDELISVTDIYSTYCARCGRGFDPHDTTEKEI